MLSRLQIFLFDKSVVNVAFLRAERKQQTLILQAILLVSIVGLMFIRKLQIQTGITPGTMFIFAVLQFGMYCGNQLYWIIRKRDEKVMIPCTLIAVHINLALFAAIISVGAVEWTPLWGAFLLYIVMIINAFSFQPYLVIPITAAGVFPAVYHTFWNPAPDEFPIACLVFTIISLILYGAVGSMVNSSRKLRIAGQQAAFDRRLADEKYRLSREIHDGIGSNLSDVRMLVDMALKSGGEVQEARLREAQEALDEGVSGLRKLMNILEVKECRFSEIPDSLQRKIRRLNLTGFQVKCSSQADDPGRPIPSPIVVHILGIAQEALSNVQKHAQATKAELCLTLRHNHIGIVIADNGKGFSESQTLTQRYGLRNMRERAEELGGNFLVDSRPGMGTRIEIGFPLQPGDFSAG